MRNRIGIVTSLALAIVAAAAARSFLTRERHKLSRGMESVRITVAREDLQAGDSIIQAMLAARSLPRDFIPERAVRAAEHDLLVGRKLRNPCRRGEAILWTDLEESPPKTLAQMVPPGERAVTIPVDRIGGLAGMLDPSAHVDIVASLILPEAGGSGVAGPGSTMVVMTLLQDVNILAVGTRSGNGQRPAAGSPGYSSVTVSATPSEAQLLVLAQTSGRLSLLLRRPGDPAVAAPPSPFRLSVLKDTPVHEAAREQAHVRPHPDQSLSEHSRRFFLLIRLVSFIQLRQIGEGFVIHAIVKVCFPQTIQFPVIHLIHIFGFLAGSQHLQRCRLAHPHFTGPHGILDDSG